MDNAEKIKEIKEILYGYEEVGLIRQDAEAVMSYLTDDVIGIGMGEQGLAFSSKQVRDAIIENMKKDDQAVYELEYGDVKINFISDVTACVCASVTVRKNLGGTVLRSSFMQSLTMVQREDGWRICALHASPVLFSKESVEAFPMEFASHIMTKLRGELQDEAFELVNQNISGGLLCLYIEAGRYPLCFANHSALRLLGYNSIEFYEKFKLDATGVIYREDQEQVLKEVVRALEHNEDGELCFRMVRKDGSCVWVIQHMRKSIDLQGKPVFLAVLTDVDKMVEMQRMLEEKTELLEVKSMLLEEQAEELALQNENLLRQRKAMTHQARALTVSEERFRIALEKTSNIIFDYDILSGKLVHSSILGKSDFVISINDVKENLVNDGIIEDEYMEQFNRMTADINSGKRQAECIVKARLASGKKIWNKISMTGIADDQGKAVRAVGLIEDITKQKEAEIAYAREEQYRQAVLADAMACYVVDFTEGVFENCQIRDNRCSATRVGEPYDRFMFKESRARMDAEHHVAFMDTFSRAAIMEAFDHGAEELKLEYNVINSDGSDMWRQSIMRLVVDGSSGHRKGFMYMNDIDKRKRGELVLTQKLEIDTLTGVYNKGAVEAHIKDELDTAEGLRAGVFMMLDIDHFKNINDTYGHPFGDEVLAQIAKALCSNFRDTDIVGRMGGDEFCVFFCGMGNRKQIESTARMICENVHNIFKADPRKISISCSLGISECRGIHKTFEQIYREADAALYHVKNIGRDGYAFYEKSESNIW